MRTAIVLFNLGGPASIEGVKPFLFNLFYDPAIITLKNPLRWILAKSISSKRAKTAEEIYRQIGGKSPILDNTEKQARALEENLGPNFKCFITMRYSSPRAEEQVRVVKEWKPERIILLPLYPQYSTTTTASSFKEWRKYAQKHDLIIKTQEICCYPNNPGFIAAVQKTILNAFTQVNTTHNKPRILFSAHGLPKKIITAGDPYQNQIEQTVAAVVKALNLKDLDHQICYQSRVGSLEWIGPSTESEIERAARDQVPAIVVPIAFVSEHSETLVELDIEYKHIAEKHGIPAYIRTPTVDCAPDFIEGLAGMIRVTLSKTTTPCSFNTQQLCTDNHTRCPFQELKK